MMYVCDGVCECAYMCVYVWGDVCVYVMRPIGGDYVCVYAGGMYLCVRAGYVCVSK